ncbi:MAG: immune inhibitor A [Bacillota bacterium]|nr:immune inhibitor A [Bacillota bacterium]
MKKWLRYVTITMLSVALTFTMIPMTGGAYADSVEDPDSVPASEAGCMSEPADRLITPDMIPDRKTDQQDSKSGTKTIVDTSKSIPLICIVAGFNNMHYKNDADWHSLLYTGKGLSQYYRDMSYGQFTFEPANETSRSGLDGNTNQYDKVNDGIIHVQLDMDHKNWKSWGTDNAANGKEMVKAFVRSANAAMSYFDFSEYDANGDKKLAEEELAVVFVLAGYDIARESYRVHTEDLYQRAHRSTFSDMFKRFSFSASELQIPTQNGVTLDPYVTMPEQTEINTQGNTVNGRISCLAHELGHHLGLPDLYDTSSYETGAWENYKVSSMSLMSGSWEKDENGKFIPESLDPWCRMMLGWITPETVTIGRNTATAQDYTNIKEKNTVLKVPESSINVGGKEYYLIEVRRTNKWDYPLSKLNDNSWRTKDGKGGMIFWHIDGKVLDEHGINTGRWSEINGKTHRPAIMPLYLEGHFDTFISDGSIVHSDTPFFDKYNWDNHYGNTSSLDEYIDLPAYGNWSTTSGPASRDYSGAMLQILSNSANSMDIAFWDNSHEHSWGYSYNVYPDTYCEEGGAWKICHRCTVCGKEEVCSEYYESEAPGHQWYEEVTKEPGLDHTGKAFRKCQVCGKTKWKTIPMLLGKGSWIEDVDKALTSYSKEKDPAGTEFSKLKLKTTRQTKNSIRLSWKKVGANKYVVYGSKCGKGKKMRKLRTTTSASGTFRKIAGNKLKAKTYYKFIVVAFNKNGEVISTSKMIHVATKGSKYKSNHTSVYVAKKIRTKAKNLKKGKTLALKAKAKKKSGCKVVKHVGLRYQSSNKKIVTVTSKGTIKGIKKGKAKVWAYAQDGVYRTIYVTVK